jgi:large repetitive protein
VLANDTDADGDALTAGMPTEPANGTLVLNADGSFTYTPDAGFNGNDTFTYMAHDPDGGMDTATVTVTVAAAPPPPPPDNTPPVAVDDAYATDFETALNVAAPGVLANDTDADGDALTAGMPTEPANGTLVLNADGSFTYTPDAGFSGNDTFTYMAHDPDGGMDTATVTITVRPATPEECKPGWGHGDKRHCHSGPPRGRVSAGIAPSLSALGQGLAAMVKVMARLW